MALLNGRARRAATAPLAGLEELGDQLSLYARAVGWMPRTLRRYRKEIGRLLAEVSFGSGALIVILGTVGVMAALSLFVGSLVGLQGFRALDSSASRRSPASSRPTSTPATSPRWWPRPR